MILSALRARSLETFLSHQPADRAARSKNTPSKCRMQPGILKPTQIERQFRYTGPDLRNPSRIGHTTTAQPFGVTTSLPPVSFPQNKHGTLPLVLPHGSTSASVRLCGHRITPSDYCFRQQQPTSYLVAQPWHWCLNEHIPRSDKLNLWLFVGPVVNQCHSVYLGPASREYQNLCIRQSRCVSARSSRSNLQQRAY